MLLRLSLLVNCHRCLSFSFHILSWIFFCLIFVLLVDVVQSFAVSVLLLEIAVSILASFFVLSFLCFNLCAFSLSSLLSWSTLVLSVLIFRSTEQWTLPAGHSLTRSDCVGACDAFATHFSRFTSSSLRAFDVLYLFVRSFVWFARLGSEWSCSSLSASRAFRSQFGFCCSFRVTL